ncbi:MAG: hypothetical protein AABZ79_25345 [Pseudomonadota bacterium]
MGSTPDDGSDALLQQAIADYLVRVPAFAFGALLEIAGRQLPMGGAIPKIPARVGTVAPGKFVGDASPIPVLSGSITGLTLPSTKCAAIMVATRELSKAAGGLSVIESMLDESVRAGVDGVLLGSAAATADAPAGLGAGATAFTGSNNALADVVGMLRLLPHAVSPVLIASMANIAALAAVLPVGGPATILASTMADAEVFVLDAADLVMGVGSAVDMSRVDDATVHMNDVALPIADEAGTLAVPVSSLWQMDLLGLRLVLPTSWTIDPARVVLASGVSWGTPAPVTP